MTLALDLIMLVSIISGLLCLVIAWRCWRAREADVIGFCAQCGKVIWEGDRCVALSPGFLFCSPECEEDYVQP